jgi:hypothetical protein
MARIRSIHYDALKSEKLAAVSAEAERLYWRLSTHCDDEGRAEDSPRLFASYLFPLHDDVGGPDVDGWLSELDTAGLIVRYEVDGDRFLVVTRWGDYQKPNRPTASKLPPPPCAVSEPSVSGTGGLTLGVGEGDVPAGAAYESEFSAWWEQYPRHYKRKAAFDAFKARRRDGSDLESLTLACKHYAEASAGKDVQYLMHGSTFLRGKDGPWSEWVDGSPEPLSKLNGYTPGPQVGPQTPTRVLEDGTVEKFYQGAGWMASA